MKCLAYRGTLLAGGLALRRWGDRLNGGRLTIDLNTGLSGVDGSAAGSSTGAGQTCSDGRVSGSFAVPDQD